MESIRKANDILAPLLGLLPNTHMEIVVKFGRAPLYYVRIMKSIGIPGQVVGYECLYDESGLCLDTLIDHAVSTVFPMLGGTVS